MGFCNFMRTFFREGNERFFTYRPGVQRTDRFFPAIYLLSALATAVYQGARLCPALLVVLAVFILVFHDTILIKTQRLLNGVEGEPSGIYITVVGILCVLIGPIADWWTPDLLSSYLFQFAEAHFLLHLVEGIRLEAPHMQARRKAREQEEGRAQAKADPEGGIGQQEKKAPIEKAPEEQC